MNINVEFILQIQNNIKILIKINNNTNSFLSPKKEIH